MTFSDKVKTPLFIAEDLEESANSGCDAWVYELYTAILKQVHEDINGTDKILKRHALSWVLDDAEELAGYIPLSAVAHLFEIHPDTLVAAIIRSAGKYRANVKVRDVLIAKKMLLARGGVLREKPYAKILRRVTKNTKSQQGQAIIDRSSLAKKPAKPKRKRLANGLDAGIVGEA